MATETATIRVSRHTRDMLAVQARARGIPLAVLLAEFAETMRREELYRSEREAARADGQRGDARAEDNEWGAALGDGID